MQTVNSKKKDFLKHDRFLPVSEDQYIDSTTSFAVALIVAVQSKLSFPVPSAGFRVVVRPHGRVRFGFDSEPCPSARMGGASGAVAFAGTQLQEAEGG